MNFKSCELKIKNCVAKMLDFAGKILNYTRVKALQILLKLKLR